MRGRIWFALGVTVGVLCRPAGALIGHVIFHRTVP